MIDCSDIYAEEMDKSVKALKRMREAWLMAPSNRDVDLFHYTDLDFSFYRFVISRQEANKEGLLTSVICKVLERYSVSYEVPAVERNAPFAFYINKYGKRTGYRFSDFYSTDDINMIVEESKADEAILIRTWKRETTKDRLTRENDQYRHDSIHLKAITIEDFFLEYFGLQEFNSFLTFVEKYVQEAREVTGYKTIKVLSSMNLAAQKICAKKELKNWQYTHFKYQIINDAEEKVQNYLYLSNWEIDKATFDDMEHDYIHNGLFETMVGNNEYAKSFITSEWLFHSLKDTKNYDFTSIISGYLKSIEQLLLAIVMMNIDNKCRIAMSYDTDIRSKTYANDIPVYDYDFYKKAGFWKLSTPSDMKYFEFKKKRLYIDFTTPQEKYMDSSTGTFEYFLRCNSHIFRNPSLAEVIADMVSCFRIECRNGYFHTHNLEDWDIVEKTRFNAILLYFMLLGGCVIPQGKEQELQIPMSDGFNELCKKIREFSNCNTDYVFEYSGGRKLNLVFDKRKNTIEYTEDGLEHYDNLLFYVVEDFSIGSYEKLDKGIREEQKLYLTRKNLPVKIYGVKRNHQLEEIVY